MEWNFAGRAGRPHGMPFVEIVEDIVGLALVALLEPVGFGVDQIKDFDLTFG